MSELNQTKEVKSLKVPGVVYTDFGSKMAPVYDKVIDKETGKSIVKKVDEFDIDEFIQASNCKTDLSMLRAEMIATGGLPTISDEVVDSTLFPENIHEVYDTIKNVDGVYNKLSDTVKGIFKDKDDFMNALIKGTYEERLYAGLNAAYEKQAQQKEEKKEGVTNE